VDMKLSADIMSKYQEHLQVAGLSLPISFSTLVLQSAAWPLHCDNSAFVVPVELVPSIRTVSGEGCVCVGGGGMWMAGREMERGEWREEGVEIGAMERRWDKGRRGRGGWKDV